MFRPSRRRSTILLLLALALVGPWAAAAEAAGRAEPAWLQPWVLAAQLWNALVDLWGESGCSVDPSGACGAGPQAGSSAESGCSLDPNGRCAGGLAGAAAESGCSLDPDGRCAGGAGGAAATTGDNGCTVDPNGGCGH
jgi:hypothetical protein